MLSHREFAMLSPDSAFEMTTVFLVILQFLSTILLMLSGFLFKTAWSEINRLRDKAHSQANVLAGHEIRLEYANKRINKLEDKDEKNRGSQ